MSVFVRLFQIAAAAILLSVPAHAAEAPQVSKAVWSSETPASLTPVAAVCCKRGYADWWAPSVHRCRVAGGYVVHPSHCVVDYRVCCKRGLRDWWSPSARACYNSGGAPVHRNFCRFD